jgi:hypothetical protein
VGTLRLAQQPRGELCDLTSRGVKLRIACFHVPRAWTYPAVFDVYARKYGFMYVSASAACD